MFNHIQIIESIRFYRAKYILVNMNTCDVYLTKALLDIFT